MTPGPSGATPGRPAPRHRGQLAGGRDGGYNRVIQNKPVCLSVCPLHEPICLVTERLCAGVIECMSDLFMSDSLNENELLNALTDRHRSAKSMST